MFSLGSRRALVDSLRPMAIKPRHGSSYFSDPNQTLIRRDLSDSMARPGV
jgi:hypothetical protein